MRKLMTLCLIQENVKLLLGMKKRGFGTGRWNGFGGKLNEGEILEEAAKREVLEEIGVEIEKMRERGVIDFSWAGEKFKDTFEVHIFEIGKYSGEISESEEMRPEWFSLDKIPYQEMWSDDIHWLPLFIAGKNFKGSFVFDDKDQVVEKNLEEVEKI